MRLTTLMHKHRKGITFIAFLIFLENIAWILEPTFFGNLIDAFILRANPEKPSDRYVMYVPLIIWIGTYLINSASGTLRRRLEPRVFQKMYVEIVTNIAEIGKKLGLDASKTAGRANLSQEYITFVQYRIPEIAEQGIAIIGAIIALTFFDFRISLVCLTISVPLVILGNIYTKKVVKIHSELHDNYESVYDMFSSKEPAQIRGIYNSMAKLHEKIAGWGALNFGVMRIVLLLIFLFVLFIAIDLDNFSTGNIYSIAAYLWSFVTSVEYLPELLESRTSLKDLSRRMKTDDD